MSEKQQLSQCRLCLKNAKFCYSLFDEDVIHIIESFTPIKIEESDPLPSICCSDCLEDIYVVHKVRCRIIESDNILRKKERLNDTKAEKVDEVEGPKETLKSDEDQTEIVEITVNPDEITINPELNDVLRRRIEMKRKLEGSNGIQNGDLYECEECDKVFVTKTSYDAHLYKHNYTMVCKICSSQVKTTNYKRHVENHASTQQICELCGAIAKNAESLRGHMFYMHKSTAEQYKCKYCGKFYRYKYKFKLHVRKAHGGDRTHICEVCGKAFYTARDVNRHIQMTHMKLRPYICQYCNKGFSSSYARRTHVRQHTNEKPFKCEVCAEGFRQRVSLKTHLKSKHGINQPGITVLNAM